MREPALGQVRGKVPWSVLDRVPKYGDRLQSFTVSNSLEHCIGIGLALCALAAQATDLTVVGLFPGKAVVVIDRSAPRTISVGQRTPEGVTLVSVSSETAVFDIDGQKRTLRMGQHHAGAVSPAADRVVLAAGEGGHFIASGQINGGAIRMLVDTGATVIALPAADARRLGISYLNAPRGTVQTANGPAQAYKVKLDTVTVGSLAINNVDAMVLESGLPMPLLGMSFLARTNMQREGDTLTLVKRF
jgi:aspartyl protease family protein